MTAPYTSLLIANRGEIAIRIARACADLGIRSVAVHAEDDAASLHTRQADLSIALRGRGSAAYLDSQQLIALAREQQCEAIHPGYGFLAENADFAHACQASGIAFIGPSASVLERFGDKAAARALAERCAVPLVRGINQAVTLEQAQAFMHSLGAGGAIMLKALAGGGGRGMRAVHDPAELEQAYARCQSEALSAFGSSALYVEQLIRRARHIEVQILGDRSGQLSHLWERDCSLQRRQQKLVEIAPSPDLPGTTRDALISAALKLAEQAAYQGIGTFEFLLDLDQPDCFYFMEANPRIQVEHTVTEAVTGVDLVHTQLWLSAGRSLAELGLSTPPAVNGCAIQVRINLESQHADGSIRPAAGTLGAYEAPSGPGLRVDGYGYAGYPVSPSYDSLLAKLIAHGHSYPVALQRAYRALCEFRLEGVSSNLHLLQNLLQRPEVATHQLSTGFVEQRMDELLAAQPKAHPHLFFNTTASHAANTTAAQVAPSGSLPLSTPAAGIVVSLEVAEGDAIASGQPIAILEAIRWSSWSRPRRAALSACSPPGPVPAWAKASRCCSSSRPRSKATPVTAKKASTSNTFVPTCRRYCSGMPS